MTEKQLFSELVKEGIITEKQAEKILKSTDLSGKSAEEILYEDRVADEEKVAVIKAKILGVPFKKIDPQKISNETLALVPYKTSRTYKVVPIEKTDGMFIVGMLNPKDEEAQSAVKFIAKQNQLSLGAYIITPSVLRAIWGRYMPYETEVQAAVRELGEVEDKDDVVGLEEGIESSDDAPIIKIVSSTLHRAVDSMTSDIHIEPQRRRLRIRFRVDGDLKEVASLPVGLSRSVVSRVKVLARMRLDETRVPQDGRFRAIIFGRNIDFRVASFPTPVGEKIVIRVLDPTTGLKGLEELGVESYNLKSIEEAINSPYGMILVTGPTGSGKSTTLYATMNRLNSEDVNIVSLEDPTEYFLEGVNQSQVMPEIGYSFASGLRQILRQDPDIIMVGEIRDAETANLAVNAALTGHILLSTLHTNNSIGVIPRLTDLGVPPFLLSSALRLMIAQRLVGRLCDNCKTEEEAPTKIQEMIKSEINAMPDGVAKKKLSEFSPPYKIFRSKINESCELCKGKGISGRVAIFEVFKMTKELGKVISKGFTDSDLWEQARAQGMITLRQDGIIKALEGKVLMEEVVRESSEM